MALYLSLDDERHFLEPINERRKKERKQSILASVRDYDMKQVKRDCAGSRRLNIIFTCIPFPPLPRARLREAEHLNEVWQDYLRKEIELNSSPASSTADYGENVLQLQLGNNYDGLPHIPRSESLLVIQQAGSEISILPH